MSISFKKSNMFGSKGVCLNLADGVDRHIKRQDAFLLLAQLSEALGESNSGVAVTCTNDRGIQDYGEPVECLYGSKVSVRDSSSAEHVACWLNVDDRSWFNDHKGLANSMSAHIDVERAKAIVTRLQTWIDIAEQGDAPFGGLAEDG